MPGRGRASDALCEAAACVKCTAYPGMDTRPSRIRRSLDALNLRLRACRPHARSCSSGDLFSPRRCQPPTAQPLYSTAVLSHSSLAYHVRHSPRQYCVSTVAIAHKPADRREQARTAACAWPRHIPCRCPRLAPSRCRRPRQRLTQAHCRGRHGRPRPRSLPRHSARSLRRRRRTRRRRCCATRRRCCATRRRARRPAGGLQRRRLSPRGHELIVRVRLHGWRAHRVTALQALTDSYSVTDPGTHRGLQVYSRSIPGLSRSIPGLFGNRSGHVPRSRAAEQHSIHPRLLACA
jgi:hypothetical protein